MATTPHEPRESQEGCAVAPESVSKAELDAGHVAVLIFVFGVALAIWGEFFFELFT
jgi:hypothetical protein